MKSTILNQMAHMKFYGMQQAYQSLLDNTHYQSLTSDELVALLIQAEWEERENRKIKRYLRAARFRYQASVEQVDFTAKQGLDKTNSCDYLTVVLSKRKRIFYSLALRAQGKAT